MTNSNQTIRRTPLVSMGKAKRPHQEFKTPVAILDYMQGVLSADDYVDLRECVFEHDRHLTKTQQGAKKHCSDAFVYTRSCALIFSDLHATLHVHCEFMHALNKCLDLSLLVADVMVRHTLHAGKMNDHDEHEQGLAKHVRFQQDVVEITEQSSTRLRADKDMISNSNSHLRFAMRYKTLARILHLSRGHGDDSVTTQHTDTTAAQQNKTSSGPDGAIDPGFRGCNAYETLKNKCMLGAILQYTARNKERLRIERSDTKINGAPANTAACVALIEAQLLKKAATMLQNTHCIHEKKERLELAMHKTKAENLLLQNELDSVQAKLAQMHK